MKDTTRTKRRFAAWMAVPALLLILQACGRTDNMIPPADDEPEPVAVKSTMPSDGPGEAGEEYTFTFVYDENEMSTSSLQPLATGDNVIFSWTWGDNSEGGQATVRVDSTGRAIYEVSHTYEDEGRFGLVLTVDDEDGTELAKTDFIIEIGTVEEGREALETCDGSWISGGYGGYGVSIDRWDISKLPSGAVVDFRYNAYSIPDKFVVEYPEGNVALDTGWRGSSSYENDSRYPGGISGEGRGEEAAVFRKSAASEFLVTVIGPGPGTAWDYDVRCTTQ